MKFEQVKYQGVATLGVNLNRQKYGPLDVSSVLLTKDALDWYILGSKDNAPEGWTGGTPYPYPGQLIVVLEDNIVYQLYLKEDDELSYRPMVDINKFYTKTEIDTMLQNVTVDLTDYYTKEEVDNFLVSLEPPEVDLSNYYTKEQIDEIVDSIEGTGEQVVVTAMTPEDILAAIGMAGEGVPVNPSGQILTEMSAQDVQDIIKG